MIIVTGAAGFIGSCLAKSLAKSEDQNIVLVDDFSRLNKALNYADLMQCERVERSEFIQWARGQSDIQAIVHMGARTDTTEFDYSIFQELNVDFSMAVWHLCTERQIPLIYASSAATYGEGEHGYKDDHGIVDELKPLNPYGESKNNFDSWALKQTEGPTHWYGLKFFNVYGPNEYHKGRMASVVYHAFNQISETQKMKLFRSHREEFKDGEQLRDFIYVLDIVKVVRFLLEQLPESGLYNLGTGQARTFNDLVSEVFKAMHLEERVEYIDTPEDIRDKYQYYTEADMQKLETAGYSDGFTSLEEGVNDYVSNYLLNGEYY